MENIISDDVGNTPTRDITKLRRRFLDLVLPGDAEGAYFVFSTDPGKGKWKDHCVDSVSQLRTQVVHQDTRGAHQNVYFALARFSEAKAGGKPDRKAERAGHFKSFFIDIDVGKEENSYECFEDAYAALTAFVEDADLLHPIIVRSGNGLHAYWPFKAAVPVEAWLPVATRFKAMLEASELVFDPSVPADAARVLRLPGTTWRDTKGKGLPDLPVELLSWGDGETAFDDLAELIGSAEVDGDGADAAGAAGDWDLGPLPKELQRFKDKLNLSINDALGTDRPLSISRNKTALRGAVFAMNADWEPEWWLVLQCAKWVWESAEASSEEKAWFWGVVMEWSRKSPDFIDEQQQWDKMRKCTVAKHPKTLFEEATEKYGWENPGEDETRQDETGYKDTGFQYDSPEWKVGAFLDTDPPPLEYLFNNLLPVGCVGQIASPGGLGKTFLAVHMGVSLASGVPLMGAFTTGRVGKVMVISGETNQSQFHRRLRAVVDSHLTVGEWSEEAEANLRKNLMLIPVPASEETFLIQMLRGGTPARSKSVLAKLKESITRVKPSLVILDNRNMFCGGDENHAAVAGLFVQVLEQIRTEAGVENLLVIEHTNKASYGNEDAALSQGASAGSAQFTNRARYALNMARVKQLWKQDLPPLLEGRLIRCAVVKINEGPMPEGFYIKQQNNGSLRVMSNEDLYHAMNRTSKSAELRSVIRMVGFIVADKGYATPTDVRDFSTFKENPPQFGGNLKSKEQRKVALDAAIEAGYIQEINAEGRKGTALKVTEEGYAFVGIDAPELE